MAHSNDRPGAAFEQLFWHDPEREPWGRRLVIVLVMLLGLGLALAVKHNRGNAVSPRVGSPAPTGQCQADSATVAVPGVGELSIACKWQVFLSGQVVQSSPNLAVLDESGPSVVVGSRDTGQVYALHLSDGSTVAGWPVSTGYAVDSSPTAVPDRSGSGLDDVIVDGGDVTTDPPAALSFDSGGVIAYAPNGGTLWKRGIADEFGAFGSSPAVYASPSAADITGSGSPSVVAAGVSLSQYGLDAYTGSDDPGWPRKTADSTFSTAAIADLLGGTKPFVVAGSDSSAGPGALDNWNGGVVRAQDGAGNTLWTHRTDEVVTSSPAVGDLDGTGDKVVFGHGDYWAGFTPTSDSAAVTALNGDGSTAWQTSLTGYTPASPALADLTGTGQLDVVEPTWLPRGAAPGGAVYALSPKGAVLWGPTYQLPLPGTTTSPANVIYGGVSTADFGEGYQDVVYASGFGWNILDGRTGQNLLPAPTSSAQNLDGEWVNWDGTVANLAMSNTPLIAPDPSGGIDIVLSGTYAPSDPSGDRGFVAVYQVRTSQNRTDEAGAWPMFHHDPQHSGAASQPRLSCSGCEQPPTSGGYWLAGADGGVFTFGSARFYGSLGNVRLAAPIVGMVATPDGKGYWLVASDGGVFTFGDAQFFGSLGNTRLNAPIVGMAATPDGKGYWLVASDGGVFTFGDAQFFGSLGNTRLNAPIVGIASTPDFPGYWLAGADGGVFTFGDATFHGSMGAVRLAQPVVGITAVPGGGGYWEVAADGGVFSFGEATFEGSMGARALAAPVHALSALAPDHGTGYREAAADGGVFTFGDASFEGSLGGLPLSAPVVASTALP